jgi:hypothetical protein
LSDEKRIVVDPEKCASAVQCADVGLDGDEPTDALVFVNKITDGGIIKIE